MIYDVSDNPMLSDEALSLVTGNADAFEAHNEVAEQVLGLTAYDAIPNDVDRLWYDQISRYVALQVSHQIAAEGEGAFLKSSSTTGPLSSSFRTESGSGNAPTVHALAARGLSLLLLDYGVAYPAFFDDSASLPYGGYAVLTSVRRSTDDEASAWHFPIR